MTKASRWFGLILLLVPLSLFAFDGEPRVKGLERPRAAFDRTAHLREMLSLQQELSRSFVEVAGAEVLEIEVPAAERRAVGQTNAREKRMRVGVAKSVRVPVDFAGERVRPGHTARHGVFGAVRGEHDGLFTWSGVIRSPQAEAVRVHFVDVDLPPGAELYVYSRDGMAFGPYTGKGPNGNGEFWSNTVVGPEVVLQLEAETGDNPHFTIAGIGHLTPEFALAGNLSPVANAADTKPCSYNANCVEDAACTTRDGSQVSVARDAVAHILYVSGAYLYICSGGLVADSDTSTNVPYFITANHCVSKGGEANSMETYFFYRKDNCGDVCAGRGAKSTTGSSIVSTNRTSDYTLLRLSQPAPTGAAFLGWNSSDIANSNGAGLYRLSHPKGAPQAYSEHVVDTSKGTCRSWPRGSWIYSRDVFGATEGGSSGSPVVNNQGQLVGQLSGGCGYNVNDVCDTVSNATVDGAFAAYYNTVSQWLGSGTGGGGDPGDPGCTDADGDGFCADVDCNDNNPAIYPGANDTKGKQGRDGVDNDCNGVIDG